MKARKTLVVLAVVGLLSIIAVQTASALESGEFAALLAAEQYEAVVSMCNSNAAAIASHPEAAQIQSICAQAQAALGGGPAPAAPAPAAPEPAPVPEPAAPSAPPVDDVFAATPEPAPAAPAPTSYSAPPPAPTATTTPSLTMVASKITAETFETPLRAEQYDQVIELCEKHKMEIESHRDKSAILKACGQAKVGSFRKSKKMTDLTSAVKNYEKSLMAGFDPQASFETGRARLLTVDTVPQEQEKLDQERKAVLEMWEAIVMRHAVENFTPAVSDLIIIWTIGTPGDPNNMGYTDLLIERVIKNEGNMARERWLAARVRMLADRFIEIDPTKGETTTRQNNLEVVKGWMTELMEKSYFDNNILVGMMTYKADRHEERYDGSDTTESEFHKALYFYDEARKRARSNKAMAVLHGKIAFICSRYRNANRKRLIEFYKKGFLHARQGLRLMQSVNKVRTEVGKATYRYEEDNADVTSNLQKAYGNNLTGYIYNLWLEKDFKGVVGLKQQTLDVRFDWENKSDVLLLFAESAKQLASESTKNERNFLKYKEMALSAGSRAFKFQLRRFGGNAPTGYDQDFCKAFNAYWGYLDSFGQLVQAKALENRYGAVCPAGGAPASSEAAAAQ